ncbi:hypothetical protein T4A_9004 [Trichinella pseudospiralis]|uniref:Uncharacterized protein n=1 Tax=Trichinella pseudospiralis TaxID=6337 RepID=A0A0V1DRE2_TRIPS|nr:hypothetical protein T4A_9004 [Trichinella pseudospiralis]
MLVSERCAANERTVAFSVRWRTKNSNKNGFKRRRIEDGREGPEDDDEFRVHLRKEKWLINLSIISKINIIEFSELLWHCYSLSIRNNSSTGYAARATLTVSNDESPYFHSSPLPHPVAVPEACRLARSPQ